MFLMLPMENLEQERSQQELIQKMTEKRRRICTSVPHSKPCLDHLDLSEE